MHKRKLFLNTISSLLQQLSTIICGFILPRYFLRYYGSEVNGLVSSVTQFLGFISFMQLGVGAVIQANLYKPLANGDINEVSKIYVSAERFFKKIAYLLLVYIVILIVLMPLRIKSFPFSYIATLILSISISLFVQYYFGITNQMLLTADQKAYISLFSQIFVIVFNTVFSIIMMKIGMSVQIVKLCSSACFIVTPVIMHVYVKHHYLINKKIAFSDEPIKQKWNGLAQHLSSVIMDNTDVIILTIFSSLNNVSIYYVYHLVVYGVRQIITSLTVGVQSSFGNLIAKKEDNTLIPFFDKVESLFHFFISLLFSCVVILICPFVKVYTYGINDANYNVPLFAVLLSLAFACYCYRLPYYAIIKAAGHFKETQASALFEMFINLFISILFVVKFGLVGVAIGTLVASLYRTVYFAVYLKKNIIFRDLKYFIKNVTLDILSFVLSFILTNQFALASETYYSWFFLSIKTFAVCLIVTVCLFSLFNIEQIKKLAQKNKDI